MSYNKETGMYEGYIYKICNDINNKIYIGQTKTTVHERWRKHKTYVKNESHQTLLCRAMRKYGVENFHIHIIEKIDCFEQKDLLSKLNELEIFYIAMYSSDNPNYGYNITKGGNAINFQGKKIDQYSTDGVFIKTWESINEAARFYNIKNSTGICMCCEGKARTLAGFVWRYHGENFNKYPTRNINEKRVKQYSIDGKLLKIFSSMSSAAREVGVDVNAIIYVCQGKNRSSKGFIWRYIEDDFDKYDTTILNHSQSSTTNHVVKQYDLCGNLMQTYNSIREASKITGCDTKGISNTCKGKQKKCGGFIWRYINDDFDKFPV